MNRNLQLLLLLLFSRLLVAQTNIGGIINDYDTLLLRGPGACGDSLVVAGLMNYSDGDLLLFYNPQGATFDTSFSASFGNVTSYAESGRYEFAYVSQSSTSPLILLDRSIGNFFGAGTMIVKVPEYGFANVNSTLTAPDFQNGMGGVLALSARKLRLSADISVNGKGFEGGFSNRNMGFTCGVTSYRNPAGTNAGAPKGQGIGKLADRMANGRGHNINGGGGGNNHNAGGGGGGNGGTGGQGGDEWSGCSPIGTVGGIGGDATGSATDRLFFGGGGGSGHNNVSGLSSEGGNGGGIIILLCDTFESVIGDVTAQGLDGKDLSSGAEGAGGGGAGGTIVFAVDVFQGAILDVSITGGAGGDCTGGIAGPGGGGGGGVFHRKSSTGSAPILVVFSGGPPGVLSVGGGSHGSTNGSFGTVNTTLNLNRPQQNSNQGIPANFLGNDTTICRFDSLTLNAPPGGPYLWSDGSTGSSLVISGPGVYWLQVGTGACASRDSIVIQTFSGGSGSFLGPDQILCTNSSLVIGTTISGTYFWSTGATTNTISVSSPGWYWLSVKVGNSCPVRDSIFISEDNFPSTASRLDTTVCLSTGYELILAPNWLGLWPDGSSGTSYTFNSPGTFLVQIQNQNGCIRIDTFDIQLAGTDSIIELFEVSDTAVCAQEGLRIDLSNLNGDLFWNDGQRSRVRTLFGNRRVILRYEEDCLSKADTLDLEMIDCDTCNFVMPNAFSPNGDGINDQLLLESQCDFESFQLIISDRWGERVFETSNSAILWDGTFKGQVCSQGIYVYDLQYKLPLKQEKRLQGYLFLRH